MTDAISVLLGIATCAMGLWSGSVGIAVIGALLAVAAVVSWRLER